MTAFTIDRICRQAGVSRGLVNHHFTTKEELLVSIYGHMTDYLLRENTAQSPQQQIAGFVESSFDEDSFNKSNLRAWLAIWGQVATNAELKALHQGRYFQYRQQLTGALIRIADLENLDIDAASIARRLIALIDGLWLEYCLHSNGFSLAAAKADCYHFLQSNGISLEPVHQPED